MGLAELAELVELALALVLEAEVRFQSMIGLMKISTHLVTIGSH